jgi:hypothetical protein
MRIKEKYILASLALLALAAIVIATCRGFVKDKMEKK